MVKVRKDDFLEKKMASHPFHPGPSTLPYLFITSWEICMQFKKQQLEPDMEQQTGSKLEKEYVKALYCHPAYLTYTEYIT